MASPANMREMTMAVAEARNAMAWRAKMHLAGLAAWLAAISPAGQAMANQLM